MAGGQYLARQDGLSVVINKPLHPHGFVQQKCSSWSQSLTRVRWFSPSGDLVSCFRVHLPCEASVSPRGLQGCCSDGESDCKGTDFKFQPRSDTLHFCSLSIDQNQSTGLRESGERWEAHREFHENEWSLPQQAMKSEAEAQFRGRRGCWLQTCMLVMCPALFLISLDSHCLCYRDGIPVATCSGASGRFLFIFLKNICKKKKRASEHLRGRKYVNVCCHYHAL